MCFLKDTRSGVWDIAPFPPTPRLITKYFIFFDTSVGYIFLLLYMLGNFWLGVICCKFYLVEC